MDVGPELYVLPRIYLLGRWVDKARLRSPHHFPPPRVPTVDYTPRQLHGMHESRRERDSDTYAVLVERKCRCIPPGVQGSWALWDRAMRYVVELRLYSVLRSSICWGAALMPPPHVAVEYATVFGQLLLP